jgi:2-methylisocitrate lyase-like PEP mutase family enzyme
MVITARAENHFRKRKDLDDTIERLLAYQEAGADVLYAPGLRSVEQIGSVLEAVERPLNVLVLPGVPSVTELAKAGVSRVSVGAAFAFAAYEALVEAAKELRDTGTHGYLERARRGYSEGARGAFARV